MHNRTCGGGGDEPGAWRCMRRRERPPMPWSPVRTVVVKKSAHMPEDAAGVRRVEVG